MARITVLKSPERINEIKRKVIKNMSAVPKSPINASNPTQTAENIINSNKFFFVCNLSSVFAPINMYMIFTISDG